MNKTDTDLLQEICQRADKFMDDVLPQIGGLAIQDVSNLNELLMLLTSVRNKDNE